DPDTLVTYAGSIGKNSTADPSYVKKMPFLAFSRQFCRTINKTKRQVKGLSRNSRPSSSLFVNRYTSTHSLISLPPLRRMPKVGMKVPTFGIKSNLRYNPLRSALCSIVLVLAHVFSSGELEDEFRTLVQ